MGSPTCWWCTNPWRVAPASPASPLDGVDIIPSIATIREFDRPRRVGDTEEGARIREDVALLTRLVDAYRHHRVETKNLASSSPSGARSRTRGRPCDRVSPSKHHGGETMKITPLGKLIMVLLGLTIIYFGFRNFGADIRKWATGGKEASPPRPPRTPTTSARSRTRPPIRVATPGSNGVTAAGARERRQAHPPARGRDQHLGRPRAGHRGQRRPRCRARRRRSTRSSSAST